MAEIIHVDFGGEVMPGDVIEIPDWVGVYQVLAILPDGAIEVQMIEGSDK